MITPPRRAVAAATRSPMGESPGTRAGVSRIIRVREMDRRGRGRWLIVATACLLGGAIAFLWPSVVNSLLYFPSRVVDADPEAAGLAFEDVEMRASDGERLHGWWIRAARPPAVAHVLFFHGNAGNIAHRVAHARLLSDAGLDVLLFDYRGYGRSTGAPDEAGTYRDARAARGPLLRPAGVGPGRASSTSASRSAARWPWRSRVEAPPHGPGPAVGLHQRAGHGPAALPVRPDRVVPDAYPNLRPHRAAPRAAARRPRRPRRRSSRCPTAGRSSPRRREPKRLEIVRGAGHNDPCSMAGRVVRRRPIADVGARGLAIAASVSRLLDSPFRGGRAMLRPYKGHLAEARRAASTWTSPRRSSATWSWATTPASG